ncbi:SusC/RagA family TonB-linked outer membrane protein [Sphingobacterium sp. HMA12]|uniref:SusC/RagA family TonB-linked outer membrane protein n=1 Tax=Sphingobacterium sp. HMA12 TaxID=2050894 RepID=UPI0013153D63|nr:SusC/RagA family TonB-linked outer membrane protein [Sphingobacterium sp. HMA12]
MKLTIIFILLSIGLNAKTNGQQINLSVKQMRLESVLKKITQQTDYKFFYSSDLINKVESVNLTIERASLEETLEKILTPRGLSYQKMARTITITVANTLQQLEVSGSVRDSKGPLAGVNIYIKADSKIGTRTDSEGRFTIRIPAASTLVFSFLGYEKQEIPVRDTEMHIILNAANNAMAEVVVTALGINKEKRKVAYAAQDIKGESLTTAREPNVASSLVGKVAGLQIRTKSTLFENPEITLRGGNATIVIDGVPAPDGFDMWSLNADDIENITVLKGTASSALYGSVAQNGAIMITTKKGKGGKSGIELTYNSSTEFQAGFLRIPKTQQDYGMGFNGKYAFVDGKGGGINDAYGYVWGPKLNQPDPSTSSGFVEIPQYNSPMDPQTNKLKPLPWISRGKNNLNNFLDNGLITTHNVSVAGSTEKSDYRISLSHLYQKGQVPNTKLNATTLSLAGKLKLNSKLDAEATLSYNRQYSPNYPNSDYSPDNYLYNIVLWMGPDVAIQDLRNYWKPGREGLEQVTYNYSWYNNPWFLAYEKERAYTNDVIVSQGNIKYSFNNDLKLLVRGGITTNFANSESRIPYSYINYGTDAAPYGNYSVNRKNRMRFVSDALLTYDKKIAQDFTITASVGASTRLDQYNKLESKTTGGLSVPEWYNLDNSRDPVRSTNERIEKQVYGMYGYVDLDYRNMATLSLTGRNDWTSALQSPYNSYFYPSASLSLIVSEMFQLPKVVSYFKLRGAVTDATTDIDAYSALLTYEIGSRWNGNPSLYLPNALRPPGLKPNKTISQEYGAELRLFRNRIGFDFTYFNYDRTNNVVEVPLSEASGFAKLQVNGDRYRRRGIELVVSGTPVQTENFKWSTTLNYSRLRNTVLEYYGGEEIRGGVKVGERMDVYRGWAWQKSPDGQIVHENGIPQYINQQVNLGYTDPNWEFGFLNSFQYKNFGLSFAFDGRIGGKTYNGLEAKMYEGGMHPNTANSYREEAYLGQKTYMAGGVTQTGGNVTYDAQGNIMTDSRTFAPNTSSVNYVDWVFATYTNGIDESVLYDRTFVKLRELTLSYQVPTTLLRKTPFKTASVSLVGRNLLLWSKVPYMDPDGYSNLQLAEPTVRNIGFNVNFKF